MILLNINAICSYVIWRRSFTPLLLASCRDHWLLGTVYLGAWVKKAVRSRLCGPSVRSRRWWCFPQTPALTVTKASQRRGHVERDWGWLTKPIHVIICDSLSITTIQVYFRCSAMGEATAVVVLLCVRGHDANAPSLNYGIQRVTVILQDGLLTIQIWLSRVRRAPGLLVLLLIAQKATLTNALFVFCDLPTKKWELLRVVNTYFVWIA